LGASWQDLYHQALRQHSPLLELRVRALRAAEASASETLKAQAQRYQALPVYMLCVELDRYQVPLPRSAR
jgi:hypothetical protein